MTTCSCQDGELPADTLLDRRLHMRFRGSGSVTDWHVPTLVASRDGTCKSGPQCVLKPVSEDNNKNRFTTRAFHKLLAHPLVFDVKQRLATANYRSMRQAFSVCLAFEDCRGLRILDVGCGTGLCISRLFSTKHNFVVGIDLNVAYTQWAKRLYPEIRFVAASADQLPFTEQLFDLVLLSSVLHHLPDPVSRNLFDDLKRTAASGATVLLSEPVWSDNRLSNRLLKWDRGHYVKTRDEWLELVSGHFLIKKDFVYQYAKTEFLGLVLAFRQSD